MLNTPMNMKIDLRKKIAEGEERDRQISLKLEKKYRPISDAIWKEKQDETYMNTLRIKPDLSLANVLANEMENINHFDPIIVNQVSTSLLLQITGQKIAEYILDRLTTAEKNRMNQYWPEILRDLKKRNLRLNKDVFLAYLKMPEEPLQDMNEDLINQIDENLENNAIEEEEEEDEEKVREEEEREGEVKEKRKLIDVLKKIDERENIRPYSIGDVSTSTFVRTILSKKSMLPVESGPYIRIWAEINSLLKEKTLQKIHFIGYIKRRIDRTVSNSLSKGDLQKIAINVGFVHKKYFLENSSNEDLENLKTGGVRKIFGKGVVGSQQPRKININKFSVNIDKLKKNILNVQYISCRGSVPNLKNERISDDVKAVILDIVEDKYNSKLFEKLLTDDQRIVSNFVRTLKIRDIDMDEFDKRYQHEYELLLGEVNSGNSNEKIKQQLKQYILRGISENLIPRTQGLNQILNL